ncbi:hypothetical protein ACQQ2Q_19940 [Agrobacterium sp. ES01]|uniref:hypothetical protein n=1 Tax=Agrobacterium sp. ES01 TaxID=3420714 RepID=UPI003D15286C
MTSTQKQRHYLAQFYEGVDGSDATHRKANLVARAVFPVAGVKSFQAAQVRIVGLSDGGAVLHSSMLEYLPEHFYLCLGEREIFITCARRKVENGEMTVTFSNREDPAFIDALCQITFPLSTLKRLRGESVRAIEARIVRRADKH